MLLQASAELEAELSELELDLTDELELEMVDELEAITELDTFDELKLDLIDELELDTLTELELDLLEELSAALDEMPEPLLGIEHSLVLFEGFGSTPKVAVLQTKDPLNTL